jgi:hypothetical protein
MSTEKSPDKPPSWLELESVLPMAKVREMTSLSDEALERSHAHRVKRLSERRKGMKLRDVLAIIDGQ